MHLRLIVPLLLFSQLYAQTTLSGNIGGVTFSPSGNPYIVKDNIIIQEDKTTTIEAGCVFLFRPFSGLIVHGSLAINGTLQSPVVFTSVFDGNYSNDPEQTPNPFDWNGILISSQAGNVAISNVIVEYSVYGIKSQKEALSLNNATFKNNGQFHFTIGEKIQQVTDGIPYSYGDSQKYGKTSEEDTGDDQTMPDHAPETVKAEKEKPGKHIGTEKRGKSAFRKAAPVILAATGLACGITAPFMFNKMSKEGNASSYTPDPVEKNNHERKFYNYRNTGVVLSGVAAVCLPVSIILFVKDSKDRDNSVSVNVTPMIGRQTGVSIIMKF